MRLRALSVSLLRTPGDGGIDAETKLSASCSVCLQNVCKFSVSVSSVWSCVLNVCVCVCVCVVVQARECYEKILEIAPERAAMVKGAFEGT